MDREEILHLENYLSDKVIVITDARTDNSAVIGAWDIGTVITSNKEVPLLIMMSDDCDPKNNFITLCIKNSEADDSEV